MIHEQSYWCPLENGMAFLVFYLATLFSSTARSNTKCLFSLELLPKLPLCPSRPQAFHCAFARHARCKCFHRRWWVASAIALCLRHRSRSAWPGKVLILKIGSCSGVLLQRKGKWMTMMFFTVEEGVVVMRLWTGYIDRTATKHSPPLLFLPFPHLLGLPTYLGLSSWSRKSHQSASTTPVLPTSCQSPRTTTPPSCPSGSPPSPSADRCEESLWRSWIWIADPDGGESALPGGHAVGVVVSIGPSVRKDRRCGAGDAPTNGWGVQWREGRKSNGVLRI